MQRSTIFSIAMASDEIVLARVEVYPQDVRLSRMMRALALVTALAACGGGGDTQTPDAAPLPDAFVVQGARDYCEAIEPFFCEFYVRCGRMDVATAADCKDAFLTSCNLAFEPRYVDLEAAGLLALDLDGVEACRQHLEAVACNQQILELNGPCADMWRGTQTSGESCGLDVESFVCAPATDCVLGLDLCGDCRPVIPLDGTCTPGTDTCASDAFCDNGTCRARVKNGDPCGTGDRCMTGSVCDMGTCTPPVFVARGETCDARRRCPYLTVCIGGTCQPTAALGASCANDGSCEVGFCEGVCQAPRENGQPCARPGQCSSGLCEGTCQPRPSACIAP